MRAASCARQTMGSRQPNARSSQQRGAIRQEQRLRSGEGSAGQTGQEERRERGGDEPANPPGIREGRVVGHGVVQIVA